MRVVNVFAVEMEEGPGRDGVWFRAAPLGPMLGAARIGAGLYEAREGAPIWPYHYHYPDEEWLYVLGGAPVLRDVAGRRVLDAGDVVCFAAGHRGAHTLEGPGRFIIFSGERSSGPFASVYPDSDKVSVSPGIEAAGLNALRLIRASSVDYWHGEGTGGSVPPAAVRREPESVPRPPRLNARDLTFEPGDGWRWASLGDAAGQSGLTGPSSSSIPGRTSAPTAMSTGESCGCSCSPAHRRSNTPRASRRCRPATSSASQKGRPEGAACSTAAAKRPAFCCSGHPGSRRPFATPRPASGSCGPLAAATKSACGADNPR